MLFFLQYSLDELHLDSDSLFKLVLSDPQFEGLLPNLSHVAATQAMAEAMSVLHTAPAPQVLWTRVLVGITQYIWYSGCNSVQWV